MSLIATKRVGVLLVAALFLAAGCGFQPAKYFPWQGTDQADALQERLEAGDRLFWAGDYSAAEAVFQSLQQSEDPIVTRQALYGLACTRFMLARNRQAYLDAINILGRWQKMSPAAPGREDPRMLLALFPETSLENLRDDPEGAVLAENHVLMQLFDKEKEILALESRMEELKKQLAVFEKQEEVLKRMDASMKEMRTRLSAKEAAAKEMTEELSKLRGQIKTFETIDQEIQEKKQGIVSP